LIPNCGPPYLRKPWFKENWIHSFNFRKISITLILNFTFPDFIFLINVTLYFRGGMARSIEGVIQTLNRTAHNGGHLYVKDLAVEFVRFLWFKGSLFIDIVIKTQTVYWMLWMWVPDEWTFIAEWGWFFYNMWYINQKYSLHFIICFL
jgi:hypothetical protein